MLIKCFTGLQLLGPENVAIVKIRCLTICTSIIWPIIFWGFTTTTPPIFGFFHGIETRSFYTEIKNNHYVLAHLIFPMSALLVSGAMKFYSNRLNDQLENSQPIFIIFGNKTESVLKQVWFEPVILKSSSYEDLYLHQCWPYKYI